MTRSSQERTKAPPLLDERALWAREFSDDVATEVGAPPPRRARGSAPAFPVTEAPPKPRRHFGDYEVLRRIGSGGMGAVYEARHRRLGRRAAVKCMHRRLLERPHLIQRFLGEAVAAARIGHPGVIDVFDYGHDDQGTPYMVLEYLDGESLADRLREAGSLPVQELLDLAVQIAETVGAAHRAGIVHRDIKPDNVFLVRTPSGRARVKVLDFGCAKFVSAASEVTVTTRLGKLLGTPWYMSPEQCQSSSTIDERSDIYALGCMLYELACGRPPFFGDLGSVLSSHLYERPTPPRWLRANLPEALERLILDMLEKKPERRPASMAEVERRLLALGAPAASPHGDSPAPAIKPVRAPTAPGPAPAGRRRPAPAARWRARLFAAGLFAAIAGALACAVCL